MREDGVLTFYGNSVLLKTIENPAFGQGVFRLCAADSNDPDNPLLVHFDHLGITGTLVEPKVKLTVQKTGAGSGTVSSATSGISCGSDSQEFYEKNTSVKLMATPDAGSTFGGGWSGACSSTGYCTVTMDIDIVVTATFLPPAAPTHILAVTKSGNGSGTVTSSPSGIPCGLACSPQGI